MAGMDLAALPIYSARAVRSAEAAAREELGLGAEALMARAGEEAFRYLRARWPAVRRCAVLCGPGNNGGDGYVLARHARAAGLGVALIAPAGSPKHGAAAKAAADYLAAGGTLAEDGALSDAELIVDALFGTGLDREPAPPYAALIARLNGAGRTVLSLDLPSGLDADSGAVHGVAVRATVTLSFIALKPGLYLGAGPEHAGERVLAALALPASVLPGVPVLRLLGREALADALPRRARTAHKALHGRLLLVAGGPGMPGAARLAGTAALRAGAGLVTLATHPGNAAAIIAGCPELICHELEQPEALAPLIAGADLVAAGPGLGTSPWAGALVDAVLASHRPLVLDADALNHLAREPRAVADACLTPHPGEAARLIGSSSQAVQGDRLGALAALSARFGSVVVLKGAATLVADGEAEPGVCDRGNPGMASAGMGDVLTGLIAGIAAERIAGGEAPRRALARAARAGVLVHALAGDRAAAAGERGLVASDLFAEIRACVNPS
jgi:ADP-dependent NAD(P)H-hydrate dehydratase / NAD(P)H-hydrate epimerase